MHRWDAIVVGSGPSGVSVARPMLEAGKRVLLLDGGRRRAPGLLPEGAYHDLRRTDPEQWRAFLGPSFEALRPAGPPSPKFDAPAARFAFAGAAEALGIEGRGFAAIGSLARGGLSTIWGAGISTWGPDELAEFPFDPLELREPYRRVAARIGVSGFAEDDLAGEYDADLPAQTPLPPAENARRLFERYRRQRGRVRAHEVRFGRPRTAVLSEPKGDREACRLCDMCVWGCRHGSIYSATHDLDDMLRRFDRLDYRPGTVARRLIRTESGWRIASFEAPLLCLAAGGLATARLVLELLGDDAREVPVVGVPGFGFAVVLPERLGAAVATREFSMAQLSFLVMNDVYGSLFPASGLPAGAVVDHMPLSRPAAVRLYRALQPALLLGNCFFPGRYSANRARLETRDGEAARLVVRGGFAADLERRMVDTRRRLSRALRVLGAFVIPGSVKPIGPGEDARYAGMLPMRSKPGIGECDRWGELFGHPGLHVVDLAGFPSMAAKHHTLTLMANAERIGHELALR